MSLDITIKQVHLVRCPRCGEAVKEEVVECVPGGGQDWYPFLESVGYYVPHGRTIVGESWYGKDMMLADEQAMALIAHIKKHSNIYGSEAKNLVAMALLEGDAVVINADW